MGHKIWSGKNAVADPGEGSPLFLDQTEARRAEKNILETRPSPLSKGLDDHPPPPFISRSGSATEMFT